MDSSFKFTDAGTKQLCEAKSVKY